MKLLDVVRHKKLGRGVVVDNWCDDESRAWGVLFEGKRRNSYHDESELALVDGTVLEGVISFGPDGQVSVGETWLEDGILANGKRVRITIETID